MKTQFRATTVVDSLEDDRPRYNVAPIQRVPVVVQQTPDDERIIDEFKWGLLPFFAKAASEGSRMINARGETIAEKPSFRDAFKRRRCVVPSSGFYEWDKVSGSKQPYFSTLPEPDKNDGICWGFAGLWSVWTPRDGGDSIQTCSIVTTEANTTVGTIHERMPVILDDVGVNLWLDPGITDVDLLKQLLIPYPGDLMRAYPVSKEVNKVANGNSGLIEPIINSA